MNLINFVEHYYYESFRKKLFNIYICILYDMHYVNPMQIDIIHNDLIFPPFCSIHRCMHICIHIYIYKYMSILIENIISGNA